MANDQTKIVGGRNLVFYDEPYATGNTLPADSAAGTAWGGSWINRGYTRDGLRMRWTKQWAEWMVDQEMFPVLRTPDTFDLRFGATLVQYDNTIIEAVSKMGATGTSADVTTVAAISGTRGHVDFEVKGVMNLTYVSLGMEAKNPGDGEAIRVLAYKGIPVGDVDLSITAGPPGIGINYECALVPDTFTSPSRLFLSRDIIPALP